MSKISIVLAECIQNPATALALMLLAMIVLIILLAWIDERARLAAARRTAKYQANIRPSYDIKLDAAHPRDEPWNGPDLMYRKERAIR